MKRSEMLNDIVNFLNENIGLIYYGDLKNKKEVADKLLKMQQEAGMLAPEVLLKGNNKGCLCTMRESCPSCGGWCNAWEPEDET